MADAGWLACDYRIANEGTGHMASEMGEGGGCGPHAGADRARLSAAQSGDDSGYLRPRGRGKGVKTHSLRVWTSKVPDTRALALPANAPLTESEAAAILHRRQGKRGKTVLQRADPSGIKLTTAELLWLVRQRADDKMRDASGHWFLPDLPMSHPTLVKCEREASPVLVDYWLARGDLVVRRGR